MREEPTFRGFFWNLCKLTVKDPFSSAVVWVTLIAFSPIIIPHSLKQYRRRNNLTPDLPEVTIE